MNKAVRILQRPVVGEGFWAALGTEFLLYDRLMVNSGKFSHSYKLTRSIWNQVSVSCKASFVCPLLLLHFVCSLRRSIAPVSTILPAVTVAESFRFNVVLFSGLLSLHYTIG